MGELIELALIGLPGGYVIGLALEHPQFGWTMLMVTLMVAALADVMDGRVP